MFPWSSRRRVRERGLKALHECEAQPRAVEPGYVVLCQVQYKFDYTFIGFVKANMLTLMSGPEMRTALPVVPLSHWLLSTQLLRWLVNWWTRALQPLPLTMTWSTTLRQVVDNDNSHLWQRRVPISISAQHLIQVVLFSLAPLNNTSFFLSYSMAILESGTGCQCQHGHWILGVN